MAKKLVNGQWVDEPDVQQPQTQAQGTDWMGQMNELMGRIQNRDPFKFDLDKNALYQNYKNQYVLQGQRAMQDTMGQAAALTGGYNSSYAQNVGQQAYGDYLTKLNAVVPEIYAQARSEYDKEGDDLYNQLNMARQMYALDYDRQRDAIADQRYQDELAYGRERDFLSDQRYQNELAWDRDWQQRQWDYNTQQQAQGDARSYAQYLLQMGILPNADQLAAAGMTAEEARQIQAYYNQQMVGTGGGGGSTGGGYRRSYVPTGDPVVTDPELDAGGTTYDPVQAALDTIRNGTGAAWDMLGLPRNQQQQATSAPRARSYQDLYNMVTNDVDVRNAGQNIAMQDEIHYAAEQGTITEAQARKLIGMIGLKK